MHNLYCGNFLKIQEIIYTENPGQLVSLGSIRKSEYELSNPMARTLIFFITSLVMLIVLSLVMLI